MLVEGINHRLSMINKNLGKSLNRPYKDGNDIVDMVDKSKSMKFNQMYVLVPEDRSSDVEVAFQFTDKEDKQFFYPMKFSQDKPWYNTVCQACGTVGVETPVSAVKLMTAGHGLQSYK